MTLEVGEAWAVAHAKRLIEWVREIESDLDYDPQALEPAASLHDCGASPKYAPKDAEHAVRSRRVIEAEVLPHLALNEDQKGRPLKAIESHDYRDPRPTVSNEALLLRKADMLGVIRMIGMARSSREAQRTSPPAPGAFSPGAMGFRAASPCRGSKKSPACAWSGWRSAWGGWLRKVWERCRSTSRSTEFMRAPFIWSGLVGANGVDAVPGLRSGCASAVGCSEILKFEVMDDKQG